MTNRLVVGGICVAWVAMYMTVPQAAPFTAGNVVVARIGDGSTVISTSGGATLPTALLEYTATGTLSQTINLPSSGSIQQTTPAGTNTNNQGNIGFYGDYLAVGGYDLPALSTRTTPTQMNQVVGLDGTVISGSRMVFGSATGFPSNDQLIKNLATSPATFYTIGNQQTTRYFNGTSWVNLSSTSATNSRDIGIYGGNLYVSAANTGFAGISQIGTGIPTTSGQTTQLVIPSGANTYGFVMFDKNSDGIIDLAYAGVDGTTNGGLTRWDLAGSVWSLTYSLYLQANGSLTADAGTRIRQLTGYFDADSDTAYLYGITAQSGTRLVSITDLVTGSSPTSYSTLGTAGENYVFRGVAIVPVPEPASLALAAAGLIAVAGFARSRWRRP